MKNKGIIIIVILLVMAAATATYFVFRRKNGNDDNGGTAPNSNDGGFAGALQGTEFPINVGAWTGYSYYKIRVSDQEKCINFKNKSNVKLLQKFLNARAQENLAVDGLIGPKTLTAISNHAGNWTTAKQILDIIQRTTPSFQYVLESVPATA